MYLLDTNICIFAINRRSEKIIRAINEKANNGIYLSALTIAELEYGVENSIYIEKNRIALMKFISIFEILFFDDYDAIQYGKLKSKLKQQGNLIGPIDMLIAAQALSKKLVLVTNNTKEFNRVDGIRVEDWSL